ncbi:MAG: flagellar hook-length control protein FliK [Desulfobulbus sp.]|nr:flagellar hook-length control protein FliK [Desulfobulbus sp.]
MSAVNPLAAIPGINPSSPVHPAREQPPLEFHLGQLLTGVVRTKENDHRFSLTINGQLLTARTTVDLRVGQQLNLQVVSLTPQIELQILTNDPAKQHITTLLPLLAQQMSLPADVLTLTKNTDLLEQLHPAARETLLWYADQGFGSIRREDALPDRLERSSSPDPVSLHLLQEAGELFRQLSNDSLLPSRTAGLAANLAAFFIAAQNNGEPLSVLRFLSTAMLPDKVVIDELLRIIMEKSEHFSAITSSSITQLFSSLTTNKEDSALERLQQLFALFASSDKEAKTGSWQKNGLQMADSFRRLGLNLEQLFLEGRTEDALSTLKGALLSATGTVQSAGQSSVLAEQLVQHLELYQLLQLKLAGESSIFYPLLLPFLQQGYLIIDQERPGSRHEEQESGTDHSVTLHVQLEGLGNLEIAIRRSETQLHIQFKTENAEQADYLASFREELEHWISGSTPLSTRFLAGAEEPLKNVLTRVISRTASFIDTKA